MLWQRGCRPSTRGKGQIGLGAISLVNPGVLWSSTLESLGSAQNSAAYLGRTRRASQNAMHLRDASRHYGAVGGIRKIMDVYGELMAFASALRSGTVVWDHGMP